MWGRGGAGGVSMGTPGEEETVRGLLASERDGVTPAEHAALQVAAD